MTDPTTALQVPSNADPIPDLVQLILGAGDLISPGAWVLWAIDRVFPSDPVEEFTKTYAGDWNAVMQSSNALEALGEFSELFTEELTSIRSALRSDWSGNAADGANAHLTTMVKSTDELESALRDIARQYRAVAVGMSQSAEFTRGLLATAMEFILIAAVTAAAGAATSWTGVGAVAGGVATTGAILKAATVARQIIVVHAAAATTADVAVGLIAGYLGAVRGFRDVIIPGRYDHPLVQP